MRTFAWVVTIVSSCFGALFATVGVLAANGAPQEAASAAIGIAFAVIPYCVSRAISEIVKINRETATKV
jgi:hypothetical protein